NEVRGPYIPTTRLESFRQLCAKDNTRVCYPTTPAQYFHMLRRQVKLEPRKPLFVMTPKSLLRLPQAGSSLDQLTQGGFHPVIGDAVASDGVGRIIVCSGKVYYDLMAEHEKSGNGRVAILRLRKIYPFPRKLFAQRLG